MIQRKNIQIAQKENDILGDLYYTQGNKGKLVLFCHGFKGFKDWGAWHLGAEEFAKAGFIFVKFNFSHNGVGQENLEEFTRLDLFYNNNYSKELNDLKLVLDWTKVASELEDFQIKETFLIGHSRGGGIALQAAYKFPEISSLATWASISNFDRFGNEEIKREWKTKGYRNFYNGRTKQDMKIGYQFYEDFLANKETLNLERAARELNKPYLIVHGKKDEAVGFSAAQRLKTWCPRAEMLLIDKANHVFGAKHPYNKAQLPVDLLQAVQNTIRFFSC